LALSGYRYSAPAAQIAFAPMVSAERFRCFFSAGSGWGSFAQRSEHDTLTATLELRGGGLRLQRIGLRPPAAPTRVSVALGGEVLAAHLEPASAGVVVVLDQELALSEGETLEIALA
jgi:non-lysosomal glucosylceramidase